MNNSNENNNIISDIQGFINLLHIPSALIFIPEDNGELEVIHKNLAFSTLFGFHSKQPVSLPTSIATAVDMFARNPGKKQDDIFVYIEELQHLYRLDISKISTNEFLLILAQNSGSCLLNKNQLGSGSGCSCILNRFTEGRVVVDAHGKILAFNDVAKVNAKRFSNHELSLGVNFTHFYPEEESKSLIVNISRALSGDQFSIDSLKNTVEGERTIRYSYSPLFDATEKPFAVLLSFEELKTVEIDKRKRESNDFFLQTLDVLGDGYWIWTAETNELFISKQVYSQLGYNQDDFVPSLNFFSNILHPSDKSRIIKMLGELAIGKKSKFESEFRMQSKVGGYVWMYARAGVLGYLSNQKANQIVGITIDISPQRKIQDELLKSENRLSKAQEIAHIGSWEEHSDASYNYWSDEIYHIFGFSKGQTPPGLSSILSFTDQEKSESLSKLIFWVNSQDQDQKQQQKIAFRYKNPLSSEKYLLLIAEPIVGMDGKSYFWQGVIQDISWQKNYERFLKEGKDNLMALVTNMPALVFATDKSGNFVFWNRACEDITGYKSKEIVDNKDAFKLLYPDYELRRKIKTQIKDMGMSLSTWEHQITTKKGEKRDIVWSAFSEFVKVEGWNAVAIGYDITYQKNNERIQAAYRRKLEALAETATDFVGMSLEDSLFHYLGTQFEKHIPGQVFIIQSYNPDDNFFTVEGVYGLTFKEWELALSAMGWNPVGRRFHVTPEMHSVYSRAKLIRIDRGLYEFTDGLVSSVAARSIEKNLELNRIFTIGLLKDSTLLGGVVILTRGENPDIDFSIVEGLAVQASVAIDRKNLEMQLIVAKEKAEESDKLKSAFLANMSHEIRTPMNAILGFSQLLNLTSLTKEKRKQYIDIINAKGNMLVKLINDIIDASKVEAGQLTLVYTSCRLNELLRVMKRFWDKEKIFLNREAVEIRLNLPENTESIEILTDEGRLEQIFTNLMSNALKFTEKGYVEFGYNIEEKTIYFFVKDTGIGIDTAQQQVIFDRFRQVEESFTRTHGGTGLGLAISKGIVDLMGGSIWVESALGKGAEFYFTLPLNETQGVSVSIPKVEMEEEEYRIPDWKNKVLLIAEDEEVNFIYLDELLSPTGVTILWAKDGLQAVELVKSIKKIDAILMDIKMPVMNGYAATMEIRQINSEIPIIAQTAYAFSEDRQKAEAAGCDEYITKPINGKDLYSIIDNFIGS